MRRLAHPKRQPGRERRGGSSAKSISEVLGGFQQFPHAQRLTFDPSRRTHSQLANVADAAEKPIAFRQAVHEICRWDRVETFDAMLSDFRYALRGLRRTPVSGAVIILLLALGIGANTIIFSLIDALLLRPLPVQRPQELVQLMNLGAITYPEFPRSFCHLMLTSTPQALSEAGCEGELDVAFSDGSNIERIHVNVVSPNYFMLLGVAALYGHLPAQADEAVLSYRFWQQRFGSDHNALGRKVLIAGHPFTLAGVLPRAFNGIQADTGPDVRITESGEDAAFAP